MKLTQYLRPNGRRTEVTYDPKTPELVAMAESVTKAGGVFECEELTAGDVSVTCELDGEDGLMTIAHEISPNGPKIHEHMRRLIEEAYNHV